MQSFSYGLAAIITLFGIIPLVDIPCYEHGVGSDHFLYGLLESDIRS